MTPLASKYLYSLVFEDTLDEIDYDRGKIQFEQFAKTQKYSFYNQALIDGSWNLDQFQYYECVGCSKITHLFAMKSKKACYQVEFPTVSAAEGAKSVFAAEFRHPLQSTRNNYVLIGVDHRTANFYDFLTVKAGHVYDVRITAQQEITIHRTDTPCIDKENVDRTQYEQQICFDKCLSNHYSSNYNCRPISYDDKIFDSSRKVDICSTKHGSLIRPGESVIEPEKLKVTNYIKEVTELCQSQCIYPCDSTSYDFTLIDKSNGNSVNTTTLFFVLMYARNGIMTFQEIPTLSFHSAVINVGGQLGLWMGLSIISVLQVISHFLNNCFVSKPPEEPEMFM